MAIKAPTGAQYGRSSSVDSKLGMTKVLNPDSLAAMLYSSSSRGRDVIFKDLKFTDITFNGAPWTVTKDAGVTTWTATAIAGGAIRGTTNTGSTDGMTMLGPKIYTGALNAGIEVRLKADAITLLRLEVGFVNALTDATACACTDVDGTPTFQVASTEAALYTWNPADTITTPRFVTNGAGQTAKAETIVALGDGAAFSPTAATYFTVRVQLLGSTGSAVCMVFDDANNLKSRTMIDKIAGSTIGGITTSTTLCPFIAIQNTATTSRVVDINYVRIWEDLY